VIFMTRKARELAKKAISYLRTSPAANVGEGEDSEHQAAAIEAFARAKGYEIVATFYDAAVKGSDPITARPGFAAMLDRIAANGVRAIICESPDRFACDLAVQLVGHEFLKGMGVALIPATSPGHFLEETPSAVLVRQALDAITQFKKAAMVARIKAARNRKTAAGQKWGGGRPSHAERRPEVVALAKSLRRKTKAGQRSLREISRVLAARGYFNELGRPFAPASVRNLLREDETAPRAAMTKVPAA
jgi:DNA invertase Pin-like site-specific DNA recombinase